MTRERTPEEVERVLGAFAAVEAASASATRIAAAAVRWRVRRRIAVWGGGVAAAALIVVCAALSARTSPTVHAPSASVTSANSVADIGDLKVELLEIREMCDVIPPEKAAKRQEIDTKLKACLERLANIEERLGSGRESSESSLPERAVVHV